jgi:hypothetical protein
MKRLILCLALLLSCAACTTTTSADRFDDGAQTAAYYRIGDQAGAAADLKAAMGACDRRLGVDDGGTYPARDYTSCMRAEGWRYGYTMRDGKYPDPDPDEQGFVCHDFVVLGVVGSSCQN